MRIWRSYAVARTLVGRISCLALSLLICTAAVFAAAAEPSARTGSPWRLDLVAPTSAIAKYEPLRLALQLSLTASQPLRQTLMFARESEGLEVLIRCGSNTRRVNARRLSGGELLPVPLIALSPVPPEYPVGYSKALDVWALFDYGANEYLFPEAGTYQVCVTTLAYPGFEGSPPRPTTIESNTVSITVSEADTSPTALCWRVPSFAALLTFGKDNAERITQYGPQFYADNKWLMYALYARAQDATQPLPERVRLLSAITLASAPDQLKDPVLLLLADLLLQQKDYSGCKLQAQKVLQVTTAPDWIRNKAQGLIAKADLLLGSKPK